MAVANTTNLSNIITPTDVISSTLGPQLAKRVTMMNLMHVEDLPAMTPVKKFRKDSNLTDPTTTLAEVTAASLAAGGVYTQTSVTATAAKMAISSALSVEEMKWGTMTPVDIATKQAEAIARGVDTIALGKASGFTQTVSSAAGLTLEDVYLSGYTIDSQEVPEQGLQKAVVISRKARHNLQIQSLQTEASAFVNSQYLSILNSTPQANNRVGSIPGYDFYSTSGFATTGGQNIQLVIHPLYALAGMFDPAPKTINVDRGTEGLYTESVTYYFFAIVTWYNQAAVALQSLI